MKKILFASYILLSSVAMVSQIDSTGVQTLIATGEQIAVLTNGGNDFVNGVPNHILASAVVAIAGFIIHLFRVGHLRKKGLVK